MLKSAAGAQPGIWNRWGSETEFAEELKTVVPYAAIAEAVIGLRVKNGLTQEEFAERVGTTQSVISRLESGTHEVRVGILNRIADAFGLAWRPVFEDVAAANAIPRTAFAGRSAAVTYDHALGETYAVRGVTATASAPAPSQGPRSSTKRGHTPATK